MIMVRVWEDNKTAGGEAQALPVFNELKELCSELFEDCAERIRM